MQLRELADKIEKLVEQKVKPEIVNINGVDYVVDSSGYRRLSKPEIETLKVNSLSGFVKLVKNTIETSKCKTPLLVNVKHDYVTLITQLADDKTREVIISATPILPNIDFGYELSVEEMIIQLSTAFIQTENTSRMIGGISNLRKVDEVEFLDDGISQKVVASNGVTAQNYQLEPIVNLRPIRTFLEVEQVETKYLFRVEKNGRMVLREADGGAWKYEAQTKVAEHLEKLLAEQITADAIRIVA